VAPDHPFPAEINSAFQLARKVSECVRACCEARIFPIVLSGNCNAAVGTVSGGGVENSEIVWFDGHGEATTPETTRSGFLDGMPISILVGRAWHTLAKSVHGFAPIPGDRIVLFGARDLEAAERTLLEESGVQPTATVEQMLRKILPTLANDVENFYVHVDLDVLDPRVATSNQWTPHRGRNWCFFGETCDDRGQPIQVWLRHARSTPIQRHVKVKGDANPYDPAYEIYFEKLEGTHMQETFRGTRTLRFLWHEQHGLCTVCNTKITRITGWRLHHCVPRVMGGSQSAENRVLLHPECHDRVHNQRIPVSKPRLPERGVRRA